VIDLGDPVPLSVEVRDPAGALADAGAVTLTITLPDGSTATPTVTKASTGVYTAAYVPASTGLHAVRWVATGANASAYDDVFDVRAPGPRWIISLADARAELGIPAGGDDEELRAFLDETHDIAERYAGITLAPRSRTSEHEGGQRRIALRWPPVRAVTAVVVDGVTIDPAGYGLVLDSGTTWLVPASGRLGRAGQQVTVAYTAGDASPPPAAARAVKVLLAHLWATQRGTMTPRNAFSGNAQPTPGAAWSFPNRVTEVLDLLADPVSA